MARTIVAPSLPPGWLRRLGVIMELDPTDPREAEGVLNPAVARGPDGALYLLPRLVGPGNYSRIGLARVRFDSRGDPVGVERLGVVLEPQAPYERSRGGYRQSCVCGCSTMTCCSLTRPPPAPPLCGPRRPSPKRRRGISNRKRRVSGRPGARRGAWHADAAEAERSRTTSDVSVCHQLSSKVHSRYVRVVADLPWSAMSSACAFERVSSSACARIVRVRCSANDCERPTCRVVGGHAFHR
jgi:hypothetical protein